ncbi:MAG TPA: hypothetical protein VGN00_04600 [Puia sp.]
MVEVSPGAKVTECLASTLQILRNKGTVPYTRMGGILYYDAAEIEQLLTKLKVQVK